MIGSALCWVLWIRTFQAVHEGWRYELYYIDFTIGFVLAGVAGTFILGNIGSDVTVGDRLLIAGKMEMALVLMAAFIFDAGNIMLVAATSLAGMRAFWAGTGFFVALGCAWSLYLSASLKIASIVIGVAALALFVRSIGKVRSSTSRKYAGKALVSTVLGGLLISCSYPLAYKGTTGDIGTGPYGGILLFSLMLIAATFFLSVYSFNLPIAGGRVRIVHYWQSNIRQHRSGILGGILCCASILALFLAIANSATM